MQKKDMTPQIEEAKQLLSKRVGNIVGTAALTECGKRTKSDPAAAQFAVGDELYISENVDDLFVQNVRGNQAAGVIAACKTAGGVDGAKAVYFSALNRSVPEYDATTGQATGRIEHAKTDEVSDVYDAVEKCATDGEVYNLLKGKSLKVVAIKPVTTARYRDGLVVGTRNRNLPVFTFAK